MHGVGCRRDLSELAQKITQPLWIEDSEVLQPQYCVSKSEMGASSNTTCGETFSSHHQKCPTKVDKICLIGRTEAHSDQTLKKRLLKNVTFSEMMTSGETHLSLPRNGNIGWFYRSD